MVRPFYNARLSGVVDGVRSSRGTTIILDRRSGYGLSMFVFRRVFHDPRTLRGSVRVNRGSVRQKGRRTRSVLGSSFPPFLRSFLLGTLSGTSFSGSRVGSVFVRSVSSIGQRRRQAGTLLSGV